MTLRELLNKVLKKKGERKNKGKIEFYKDKEGEYRWRIFASTGDNIANCGQGYKNKEDCRNGLDSVKWHIRKSEKVVNW